MVEIIFKSKTDIIKKWFILVFIIGSKKTFYTSFANHIYHMYIYITNFGEKTHINIEIVFNIELIPWSKKRKKNSV